MRLRNNIIAEAFNWLKQNREGIKYQKDLAAIVGVSEDTITRILKDKTEVTDDFISKFNAAFDNVFNFQWLRGEDPYHMLAADLTSEVSVPSSQIMDELERLKRENADLRIWLNDKQQRIDEQQKTIDDLRKDKETLRTTIEMLQQKDMLRDSPFPIGVADRGDKGAKDTARV